MHAKIFDLGKVQRDAVVTVYLDATANVRLLTKVNFQAYLKKQFYRMHGGVATAPMFKISIPVNAHWFLVLDVDGLIPRPLHPKVSVAR
jgi:hypothetical protein